MNMSQTASSVQPDRKTAADRGDRFFLVMSYALLLIVLVGFAPTLYLRSVFDDIPRQAYLLYVHGGFLTAWFIWLCVQTTLVARGRTGVHRQLGKLGIVIAIGVVIGTVMAVFGLIERITSSEVFNSLDVQARAARLDGLRGGAVGFFGQLILFSSYFSASIYWRRRPQIHKRLMLLASIVIVAAALSRISRWAVFNGFVTALGFEQGVGASAETLFGLGGTVLLLITLGGYDFVTRRRLHWVTVLGSALLLAFFFVVHPLLVEAGLGASLVPALN